MPGPENAADFLALLERSQLLEPARLREAVAQLDAVGMPISAAELAARFREAGLITAFHETQLLAGRHRGFRLGKYRILDLLGAGGMGRVYLAEHAIMRRQVALKVLPKEKSLHGSALGRFQREARAVAALDHPNIVRAYDIDNEGDVHFMVMEYVPGRSLQQYVAEYGPVPWRHAADFIRQAADALEHAAEAGMVHRDIKPGNLLVDPNGAIKLLDLGLAVLFEDQADGDPLTVQYQENVLGTADYLAPEQAIDSHNVDTRADIYSLGATFYFILTGRPPFPAGTIAQKLLAHQQREPQPVEELAPDVPPEIAAALRRMMRKKPEQRYPSPKDVVAALAPFAVPLPQPFSGARRPVAEAAAAAPTMAAGATPLPAAPVGATPRPAAPRPPDPPPAFDFLNQPASSPGAAASSAARKTVAAAPLAPPRFSGETKFWIALTLGAIATLGVIVYLLRPAGKPSAKPSLPEPAAPQVPAPPDPKKQAAEARAAGVEVNAKLGWRGARTVREGLLAAEPGQTVWLAAKESPWDTDGLELGVADLARNAEVALAGIEPRTPLASARDGVPVLAWRGGTGLTLRDLAFAGASAAAVELASPQAKTVLLERVEFRACHAGAALRRLPAGGAVVFRECVFFARADRAGAELAAAPGESLAGTVTFERCVFVGGLRGIAIGGPLAKLAVVDCRFLDCTEAGVAWTGTDAANAAQQAEVSGCTFHGCGAAVLLRAALPAAARLKVADTLVSAPRHAPALRPAGNASQGLVAERSGLTPGAPVNDGLGLTGDALKLAALPAAFKSLDPASGDFLKPQADPAHARISPQRGYVGAVPP